jgi:hypothetical protein
MPELREHPAALGVDSLHNLFPAFHLLVGVHPGCSVPAPGGDRDGCGLGDNVAAIGRSLRIVLQHHIAGNVTGLLRSVAREGSHHHAVFQQIRSNLYRREKFHRVLSTLDFPWVGFFAAPVGRIDVAYSAGLIDLRA